MPYARLKYTTSRSTSGSTGWHTTWRTVPPSAKIGEQWAFVMPVRDTMRDTDWVFVGEIDQLVEVLDYVPAGSRDTTARRPVVCRIDMSAHRQRAADEARLAILEQQARDLLKSADLVSSLETVGTGSAIRLAAELRAIRERLEY